MKYFVHSFIHSILKKDENTKSLTNISKSASPRFGLERKRLNKKNQQPMVIYQTICCI